MRPDLHIKIERPANKLDRLILIKQQDETGLTKEDIGYIAEVFTRLHMPMSRPKKEKLIYERRDGRRTLRLIGHPEHGLMYGDDLNTLMGLMTKAYREIDDLDNPHPGTVIFGSTAEMLDYFGRDTNGDDYKKTLASIQRIHGANVEIIEQVETMGKASKKRTSKASFLSTVELWVNMDKRQMGMKGCENSFTFTPEAVQMIRRAKGIEFDKMLIQRRAPGQRQLFALLRDRCAADDLKQKAEGLSAELVPQKAYDWIPVHGPSSLESQLGWDPDNMPLPKEVRRSLRKWIKKIRATIWPECPGELHRGRDGHWRLKVWYVPAPSRKKR